jgi:phytol kinase
MPSPGWWQGQLVGVAVVSLWLAALSLVALRVRDRWPEQREWSRKLIHIGSGPVVIIAWICRIEPRIAVAAAATITLLAALNHRIRVLPAVEDIDRHSYGTIAYGASITVLLLLYFPEQPAAAAAGVMVMALGDGLAGLVGPLFASPSWEVLGQRRSLLGTAAMALASFLVLLILSTIAPGPGLGGILAIVSVATVLEQVSLLGIDNLSVPIMVGWLWSTLS